MNTIEELDDFEFSIHEKLVNYEVVPPIGSWNAIAQTSGTESKRMKLVWINRGSFLLMFVSSMLTMWFAFGSIFFEFDKTNKAEIELSKKIRESLLSSKINETFSEEKLVIDLKETMQIESPIIVEAESVYIKNANEILGVNSIGIKNIESPFEKNKFRELSLETSYNDEISKLRTFPRLSTHLIFDLQTNLVKKSKNYLQENSISNFKNSLNSFQLGIGLGYSLSKHWRLEIAPSIQMISQEISYIETVTSNYTKHDTVVIGYIQDPFLGTIPVIEITSNEVTDISNNSKKLSNDYKGFNIPININWIFYSNSKIQMQLSGGLGYSFLKSKNNLKLNSEGVVLKDRDFTLNTFYSKTSIQGNYYFNSKLGLFVESNLIVPMNNDEMIQRGFNTRIGLKYKLY